jgi:hypothetical protein
METTKKIIDSLVENEESIPHRGWGGCTEWFTKSMPYKRHRLDGPAIEYDKNARYEYADEYWVNGQHLTAEEFMRFVDPVTGNVTFPLGYKFTLRPLGESKCNQN